MRARLVCTDCGCIFAPRWAGEEWCTKCRRCTECGYVFRPRTPEHSKCSWCRKQKYNRYKRRMRYEQMKADPEKWAAYLEYQRETMRARRRKR